MPACWVISPIVTIDGVNKPKVATLADPGAPGHSYHHSSVIYPERGKTWALSYVTGVDFSGIDADQDCKRVFDEVVADRLAGTRPGKEESGAFLDGKPTTSLTKLSRVLDDQGADKKNLTADSSREEYIKRLGMAASGDADFHPQGWYTR